MSNNGNYY